MSRFDTAVIGTKSIRSHEMPFGATVLPDGQGTRFRLWAPSARQVELIIDEQAFPMARKDEGWFEAAHPQAEHGTLYQYRIDGDLKVPDPASRYQPQDVHGPSMVIDPARFEWKDTGWRGRPWQETILYELHVGTFTPEGTFQGVKDKLDYLADLGVTAIELMPLADFPGARNWGYDGVLQFAPDSRYGTPEDLKDLIQTAHQKGLMVFLDVVYNHFGPEGNYLHAYAKEFFTERYHTPWGAAINYEGPSEVRRFFEHNAIYWLNEYHFDGLRFDAVHAIFDASDRHFLRELPIAVRTHVDPERHIHLVLENDDNTSRYLRGNPNEVFTAQWNDDFHHAMHVLLSGDTGGYYEDYTEDTSAKSAIKHLGRCLTEGYAYQGDHSPYRDELRGEKSADLHPLAFVNFLQNHDQIGNRAFGDRLISLSNPEAMRAALSIFLLAPSVPLIYMGQEWESTRPFLFFCDFNAELAPLVTEGRRKEFARFPEFSKPENRERIPDPSSPQTFETAKLDWNEAAQPEHELWLRLYRNLLAIRRQDMRPLIEQIEAGKPEKHFHEILGKTGLLCGWKLADGSLLGLAANLGPEPLTFTRSGNHNLEDPQLIYQTENGVLDRLQSGGLPAWSAVWFLKEQ